MPLGDARSEMTARLRSLFRNYPALAPLLAVCAVIVPQSFDVQGVAAWIPAVAMVIALMPWLRWGSRVVTMFVVLFAGLLLWCTGDYGETHYTRHFTHAETGITAKVRITDALLPQNTADYLPMKSLIEAEMLMLCVDTPIPTEGLVMLRIASPKMTDSLRAQLVYGAEFEAEGVIGFPEPPLFGEGFRFDRWLEMRGTPMVFDVRKLTLAEKVSIPFVQRGFRLLFNVRDAILARLTAGLDHADKRYCAALVFGCRQGLDYETRRDFIGTGTIHLFAVSGLHVGLLAGLLLLALKPFGSRGRDLLLIAILFLYVLSTGLQPSAFRAWIMISFFTAVHGLHLRSKTLNTIMLAASALLLINPNWLFDMGFQYSFAVTAFLVLSWRPIQGWLSAAGEYFEWVPLRYRTRGAVRRKQLFRKIVGGIAGCFTALGASAPLMSFYNGFFMPLSLFLNFAVIPSVGIVMGAFLLKLLIPWEHFGMLMNLGIELGFGWMISLCAAAARLGEMWQVSGGIPWWMVGVIWVLLIIFLMAKRPRISLSALTLLLLLTVFAPLVWHRLPFENETYLIHGGRIQTPILLHLDHEHRHATLVNTGNAGTLSGLPQYLRKSGYPVLHTVILTAANAGVYRGVETLLREMPPETIVVPARIPSNSKLPDVLTQAEKLGVTIGKMTEISRDEWLWRDPFYDFRRMRFGYTLKPTETDTATVDYDMPYRSVPVIERLNYLP